MQHKYRFSNPELIEKFNLVQSDKDAIKAEMEARERSRELENLVLEMFDLKARGEVSQVEDTNTLLGSYENIIFVKEGEELEDEVDENAEEEDDSSEPFEEDIEDEVSLKSEDGPKKSKKPFKSKKLTKNWDRNQVLKYFCTFCQPHSNNLHRISDKMIKDYLFLWDFR